MARYRCRPWLHAAALLILNPVLSSCDDANRVGGDAAAGVETDAAPIVPQQDQGPSADRADISPAADQGPDSLAPSAKVTAVTSSTITLDWAPPAAPPEPVASYRLGWDTSAAQATVKSWSNVYAAPPDPFVFTNLAADATYAVYVEAIAESGATARTTVVAKTSPNPATAPGLPKRVTGIYWPHWHPSAIRIRDLPANYNLVYLFAAQPVGGSPGANGAVFWSMPGDGRGAATHFKEDIAHARTVQGRRIVLSVGGAGNGMSFTNRAQSQSFVSSIVALYDQHGPFDGIDWNTYEAGLSPNTAEYTWISLELKARYPGFLITSPPAPWNPVDKAFCVAMTSAGALDFVTPQFYDGPGLADQQAIVSYMEEWATAMGGWDRLGVGFGVIAGQANYMTIAQAVATWNQLEAAHPTLRGIMDWEADADEQQGWPVADQLAPLVLSVQP